MTKLLLALLTLSLPTGKIIHVHFDFVDYNQMYGENGKLVFRQILLCNYDKDYHTRGDYGADFRVEQFILDKDGGFSPYRRGDHWYFFLCHQNFYYKISCDNLYYSYTQDDPELNNRNIHPRQNQRGLPIPTAARPIADIAN